jgi:hypothetical protein
MRLSRHDAFLPGSEHWGEMVSPVAEVRGRLCDEEERLDRLDGEPAWTIEAIALVSLGVLIGAAATAAAMRLWQL